MSVEQLEKELKYKIAKYDQLWRDTYENERTDNQILLQ